MVSELGSVQFALNSLLFQLYYAYDSCSMGIDIGFDMYPKLSSAEDLLKWSQFFGTNK